LGASDGYLVKHNPHDPEGYYFFQRTYLFCFFIFKYTYKFLSFLFFGLRLL